MTDDKHRPIHVTKKEVADMFAISTKQLERWIERGRYPPPIKLDKRTLRFSYYEYLEMKAAYWAGESEETLKLLVRLLMDDRG